MLSDDDLDEDFIPDSLADFLKEADEALNEHTQMFLNEFSPSPTPNQSGESTDCEISNLDELQSNMEKITILDRPKGAVSAASDDHSDLASPVARHSPAADLTLSEIKRSALGASTPTSMNEEKKAPFGQSEVTEDSRMTQDEVGTNPNPNPLALSGGDSKPSTSPEITLKELSIGSSSDRASVPGGTPPHLEVKTDQHASMSPLGFHHASSSQAEASPLASSKEGINGPETASTANSNEAKSSQAGVSPIEGINASETASAVDSHEQSPQPEASPLDASAEEIKGTQTASHLELQEDTGVSTSKPSPIDNAEDAPLDNAQSHGGVPPEFGNGDSAAGRPGISSTGSLSDVGEETNDDNVVSSQLDATGGGGEGNPSESLELGTNTSDDSSLGDGKNQTPASNKNDDKATSPRATADSAEPSELDAATEKPEAIVEQVPRSFFGAFSSFAKSVVPSSKSSQSPKAAESPTNPTKSGPEAEQADATLQKTEARPPSPLETKKAIDENLADAQLGQASPRAAASPTRSVASSTEEMMQPAPPAGAEALQETADPFVGAQMETQSVSSTEEMMQHDTDNIAEAKSEEEIPEPSGGINRFEATSLTTAVGPTSQQTAAVPDDQPMQVEIAQMELAFDATDARMVDRSSQEASAQPAVNPKAPNGTPRQALTDGSNDKMLVEETTAQLMDLSVKPSISADNSDYVGGSITSHGSLAQRKGALVPPTLCSAAKVSTGMSTKPTRTLLSPKSRLIQPTASSRRHTSAEKRAASTPTTRVAPGGLTPSSGKRPTPTRIPVPSTVKVTTSVEKKPVAAPVQAKSRFMQPTAAKRAHATASAESKQGASGAKRTANSHASSRLMRGTAASRAKVSSSSPPVAVLPQKRNGPNDAVARARERVRLRKLQETKSTFQGGSPKFNLGTKPKEKPRSTRDTTASRVSKTTAPHFATPTSATKAHQNAPSVSMAQSAVFFGRALRDESQPSSRSSASARRRGLTVPQAPKFSSTTSRHAGSRINQPTSATKAHHRATPVSMAQSSDFFGKGLRGGEPSPPSRATKRQGLTVPEGPKFATSKRHGGPNKRVNQGASVSLAQSTNLLANTLRGYDSTPPAKRSAALTRPQAPKFHAIHKRPLPPSTTEKDLEEMKKHRSFRARPFKANHTPVHAGTNQQKSLHTGSSAGLTKVAKRGLTKPKPFKLSSGSGSRSTKMKPTTDAGRVADHSRFAVDMKSKKSVSPRNRVSPPKSFKARPLPKSTFKGPSIPVHTLTPHKGSKEEASNEKAQAVAKQSKSPTTPEPFQLESVKRHEALQDLMLSQSQEEAAKFKALPLPSSTYTPDI